MPQYQATSLSQIEYLPDHLNELARGPAGSLYTIDRDEGRLIRFDPATGNIVSFAFMNVQLVTHPRGFTSAPDGQLYAVSRDLELLAINGNTGQAFTVFTITGLNMIESIAFSPSGRLYAIGDPSSTTRSNYLYEIDLQNGTTHLIGSLPVNDIDVMTWGCDGFIYAEDAVADGPGDLLRINPTTLSLDHLGPSAIGDTVNGMIAICDHCPCPGDWNADGMLNTADFVAYLGDYSAAILGLPPTFANPDIAEPIGLLNTADFVAFLNRYTTGCF